MEEQAILALGTLTLISCGAGLVFIHSSNPLLKGLNWMGCALLTGGAATALLLVATAVPALQPVANVFALLAFMCCYRADQYLVGHEARIGIGKWLLGFLGVVAVLQWTHLAGARIGIFAQSVALAAQMETTARLLYRTSEAEARFPARFTAGMMRALVVAGLLRAALALAGVLDAPRWAYPLETLTYGLFIASAVALGFAFFWRTTTKLAMSLEHMASTDPLTRVYNRRVFLAWFDKELLASRQSGLSLSVLLLDFDHFKHINDSFGHQVGDEVLCAAVERIQDSIRGIDVLCRWGGEEFAVLLPNATAGAALIVAERIRQNVRLVNASMERLAMKVASDFQLTVSVGAATCFGAEDGIEAMLQRADMALYEAKDTGRDRVVTAANAARTFQEPAFRLHFAREEPLASLSN